MTSEKSYDVAQRMDAHIAAHLHTVTPAAAVTLATTMTTVLSDSFGLGTFRCSGMMIFNPTASGGTPAYKMQLASGLVAANARATFTELYATNQVGTADYVAAGTNLNSAGSVGASLNNRLIMFTAWVPVTTPGVLNIQMLLSSGAGQVLLYGTYMDVWQVT